MVQAPRRRALEGARQPGRPGRHGIPGRGRRPYKRLYEIKTKDDPKAWADADEAVQGAQRDAARKLEAALAPMLDIDGALKFLALEVALVNSDGYWTRASDYSLYQDPRASSTSSRTT